MTPPEPRTAAGQAYLQSWQAQVRWIRNRQKHGTFAEETYLHEARDAILAIEAEAFSKGRSDSLPSTEWEEAHAIGYREGHRAGKIEAEASRIDVERHWTAGYFAGREDDEWRDSGEIAAIAKAYETEDE
jgi:hypothetical protein